MSKATPQNVIDLGFDSSQFGKPNDFTAYVQEPLDDVALRVRDVVGATTYDAADSAGTDAQKLDFMRIKNAEMYLTAGQLWRRIEMFERTSVIRGREAGGTETIGSRALTNAEAMEEQADIYLMQMGVSLSSDVVGGIAVGTNESGHYTAVS